jgi:hypothetical protein
VRMESGAIPIYQHRQIGTFFRWAHGLGGSVFAALAIWLVASGNPADVIGAVIPAVLMFVCIPVFDSMTVHIYRGDIRIWIGIGLIRKMVMVHNIENASILRTRRRKGGRIRGGVAYKVGGYEVVELELRDGQVVQIGSDEPQKLLDAIESVRR